MPSGRDWFSRSPDFEAFFFMGWQQQQETESGSVQWWWSWDHQSVDCSRTLGTRCAPTLKNSHQGTYQKWMKETCHVWFENKLLLLSINFYRTSCCWRWRLGEQRMNGSFPFLPWMLSRKNLFLSLFWVEPKDKWVWRWKKKMAMHVFACKATVQALLRLTFPIEFQAGNLANFPLGKGIIERR